MRLIGLFAWAAGTLTAQVALRPHPLDTRWLSVPDATKTLMRSGYDYNDANYDSGNLVRVDPPGKAFADPDSEWVLFDAPGPGVLTSMWFTGKNKKGQPYIGGKFNFYFDGERSPSFSYRLPEFLEDGRIIPAPLAEKSHGGWVCYAPIYYARSLKLAITEHNDGFTHRKNGRGETIPHLYHQFTYQKFSREVKSTRPGTTRFQTWRTDGRGKVRTHGSNTARLNGQGILNELRVQVTSPADDAPFRITVDGATTVDMRVSEFWGFSRAQRPNARMQSLLLGVEEDGVYYCRFPMPFRKELRIETGSGARVTTRAMKGWTEKEQFYFRADRITDTTVAGRDIRILEASGRGHFVGTIIEVADRSMEGDDRFTVDGETFPPSWHGTGTEDYFRCGWYFFGGPVTRPLYGMLDNQKPKIAYRFHLADRVNWTRSAILGFEHGEQNRYLGPYKGVVFWYSESP